MSYHTCLILNHFAQGVTVGGGGNKNCPFYGLKTWLTRVEYSKVLIETLNPWFVKGEKWGFHLRSAHRIQRSKRERPAEALGPGFKSINPSSNRAGASVEGKK